MTEEFLHYIWKYRLYKPDLHLTSGEEVIVIHPGEHNLDSGPDFFNARIKIGSTLWAGNVEIHVTSSDWIRHNHHSDKAYDNVILHVVYQCGKILPGKHPAPTLELKDQVSRESWKLYLKFMSDLTWIPCEKQFASVEPVVITSWLERLLVERLERKAESVLLALSASANDWNQAFYRLLARTMGFKLNNQAFEQLASSLSYNHLCRHADNLEQVEALVFGQAGFLSAEFHDKYAVRLKREYEFLRRKFSLTCMDSHLWKFMRIHPGNFPTVRLSQFAAIIHKGNGRLMQIIEANDTETLMELFNVSASEYWQCHLRFDKPSHYADRRLGAEAMNLLVINLVAPFLFVYGRKKQNSSFMEKAITILEIVKSENNSVIRKWRSLGIELSSASQSQALLELKSNYCDRKKCLSCRIGISLLRLNSETKTKISMESA